MKILKNVEVWSFINAFILTAVVLINALASILPLNGLDTGQLSDLYPNLFVPAGLTFSIWGIIYILLIGFAVYGIYSAFSSTRSSGFIKNIGPWFLISSLGNICWIFSWHWKQTVLSLVFMIVILVSLIMIYLRIRKEKADVNLKRIFLIRVPFSVYLGWITVATIANITTVLVNYGWFGTPFTEIFWTILVIIVSIIISGLVLYFQKDRFYSTVIIWALLGIVIKRNSVGDAPAIMLAATIGILLIMVFAIMQNSLSILSKKT